MNSLSHILTFLDMEDIRSLSKDVKRFSQELDNFEQYLEKDSEPPDCDKTIKKFRFVMNI